MTKYEEIKLELIEKVYREDPGWKKKDLQGFSVDDLRILLSSLISYNRGLRRRYGG